VEEAWEAICASVEATVAPLREKLEALEDYEEQAALVSARISQRVQALSDRVAALEANTAHHEQAIGEQYAAVGGMATGTRLSPEAEKVYDSNPNPKEVMPDGNPRPHVTPPPVAEKDAAGGEEGPSVEEVLLWIQFVTTGKVEYVQIESIVDRWGGTRLAEACIRLIRAGQRDTRPVLTDEMKRSAAVGFHRTYTGLALSARTEMEQQRWVEAAGYALLATGLVREASDGE
jgi:hypothetical protein